jgi:uncharacterized protein (DUF427 family)
MERVWDYPRPPAVVPCKRRGRVELDGEVLADSTRALRDHVAFYPGRVDAAWLDDERVQAQQGDFYGGWITADLIGPFKGPRGTLAW